MRFLQKKSTTREDIDSLVTDCARMFMPTSHFSISNFFVSADQTPLTTKESTPMKEIVLPSGKFAALRPITWWDRVLSVHANTDMMVLLIATRIVLIDGAQLTLEQAQAMDLQDAQPIINSICEDLVAGYKAKGVA
jgi:hypothetical protein